MDGSNYVNGIAEDQSPYRSELAGVIGILVTVDIIVKQNNITTGSITIALDGESALLQAKGDWPLRIDQPNFDYLQEICYRVAALPIEVKWQWVKGHQLDTGYRKLD